jgi:sugar (pentulose or hexulose) kinase
VSLLEKLGVADLLARWPSVLLAPGEVVGQLTPTAARHTGLPAGLPVAQGGADAFIGMLGLAVIEAGEMALLTGVVCHALGGTYCPSWYNIDV